MSKNSKNKKAKNTNPKGAVNAQTTQEQPVAKNGKTRFTSSLDPDYWWCMSHSLRIDESNHPLQILPITIFTAFVVLIVRMYSYQRDMADFYWRGGGEVTDLADFFSHYKVIAIVTCAILALTMLLYRLFTQSLSVRRSIYYIPIAVYVIFVLLSYAFSEHKFYAWNGWNDRFEGTYVLIAYMLMLFYIINTVNTEKNVKWIVYPLAATSGLLSLLGISQALDKDFFRTSIGQKLLVPNATTTDGSTMWQLIDAATAKGEKILEFTFTNKQIYQTVYNINYVSFYLTLLIPLFGLLFIREKKIVKKTIWGLLFALLIYNLIGSASSGGLLGMFFVLLVGVILLNKRIISWWKPVLILLAITIGVSGLTYDRWFGELSNAVNGVLNVSASAKVPGDGNSGTDTNNAAEKSKEFKFDYIITDGDDIKVSIADNEVTITANRSGDDAFSATDQSGESLSINPEEPENAMSSYRIDDERFNMFSLSPVVDSDSNEYYLVVQMDGQDIYWPLRTTDNGLMYRNDLGKLTTLENVPHIGWESNPGFGSGRGYIWSRTLPMMADTALLGYGADTYAINYPHKDYVGKYNADWNINLVVDKPHNMYMGVAVGTGGVSLLALLALFGIYLVQSFRLYFRRDFEDDFNTFTGAGIFLGICGFLTAALVNDSSVSVMPMFYGLLGTGIAINMMLARKAKLS